jgi:hypothetical protein
MIQTPEPIVRDPVVRHTLILLCVVRGLFKGAVLFGVGNT